MSLHIQPESYLFIYSLDIHTLTKSQDTVWTQFRSHVQTAAAQVFFHPSKRSPQQYVPPKAIPQTPSIVALSVAIVGSAAVTVVSAIFFTLTPSLLISSISGYPLIGLLPSAIVVPTFTSLLALAVLQMFVIISRVVFPADVSQLLVASGITVGIIATLGTEIVTASLTTPVFTAQVAQTQTTVMTCGIVVAVIGLFAVALSMHTPYIPSGTTYQSSVYDPTDPPSSRGSLPQKNRVTGLMRDTLVSGSQKPCKTTDPVLTQLTHSDTHSTLSNIENTLSESTDQPATSDDTAQRSTTKTDKPTNSMTDQPEKSHLETPNDTNGTANQQIDLTDTNTNARSPDGSPVTTDEEERDDTPDPYADLDLRDTDPVFSDVAHADPADTDNGLAGQNASDSPVDTETETEADEQKSDIDFTEFDYDWTRDTNVAFSDVGGMEKLKSKIYRDVIEPFTTKRKQAKKLGIPVPNVLFYGPPGTGKTHFAQAIASELSLPFVKLSGGDITSKWINESTNKVATLFTEATTVADACDGAVIFLDEIDSVLKDRSSNSHEEDHKVVNEFLNRLEDTSDIDSDILFIGATNRYDRLDAAGVRTGRIDKEIEIGKPDRDAREAVFTAQLNDRPHNLTPDMLHQAAVHTSGYVPADIEGIVTDAARRALYAGDGIIQPAHLEQAIIKSSPSIDSDPYSNTD